MWYIMSSLESLDLYCASATFLYMRLWMMAMPQNAEKAWAISSSNWKFEYFFTCLGEFIPVL